MSSVHVCSHFLHPNRIQAASYPSFVGLHNSDHVLSLCSLRLSARPWASAIRSHHPRAGPVPSGPQTDRSLWDRNFFDIASFGSTTLAAVPSLIICTKTTFSSRSSFTAKAKRTASEDGVSPFWKRILKTSTFSSCNFLRKNHPPRSQEGQRRDSTNLRSVVKLHHHRQFIPAWKICAHPR